MGIVSDENASEPTGTIEVVLKDVYFREELEEEIQRLKQFSRVEEADTLRQLISKYVEWGEYVTIEFDFRTSQVRVLPNHHRT